MAFEIIPSYVAGFFDGEGCVCIVPTQFKKRKDGSRVPGTLIHITITNTHLEVLQRIHARYGGTIQPLRDNRMRRRQLYNLRVMGCERQKTFLRDMLPFSIVKREQIEIGLEYLETQRGGLPLPEEVRHHRLVLRQRLSDAKHAFIPVA